MNIQECNRALLFMAGVMAAWGTLVSFRGDVGRVDDAIFIHNL